MKTSSSKHLTSILVHCRSSSLTNRETDWCSTCVGDDLPCMNIEKIKSTAQLCLPGRDTWKGEGEKRMWTYNHVHIDTNLIRSFRFRWTVIIDPFGVSEKRTSVCLFDDDTWQWFHKRRDNWDYSPRLPTRNDSNFFSLSLVSIVRCLRLRSSRNGQHVERNIDWENNANDFVVDIGRNVLFDRSVWRRKLLPMRSID